MKMEIERRANLSYSEFAKEYLYANKPVVITDAMRQWKAVGRWTPDFFKQEFGSMKFAIDDDLKRKAGYKENGGHTDFVMSQFIDQVLQSTEENPAPYFRNKILYDLFPSLKQDIEPLPEYFLPNWLPDRFLVKHVGQTLNRGAAIELYIGGKGGSFPVLHYDGAATHAFLMQIYGLKEFIIFSPDQEKFLYPSPEKENLSQVNVGKPDLEKFPLYKQASPTTFILNPGELLFVPSHWWHTTKMLSPSITISINVANQSNWRELVDYVAMRQKNPLVSVASRMYLTAAGAKRSWRDRTWRKRAQA
jgi:histone arginine demethylase JMJD6